MGTVEVLIFCWQREIIRRQCAGCRVWPVRTSLSPPASVLQHSATDHHMEPQVWSNLLSLTQTITRRSTDAVRSCPSCHHTVGFLCPGDLHQQHGFHNNEGLARHQGFHLQRPPLPCCVREDPCQKLKSYLLDILGIGLLIHILHKLGYIVCLLLINRPEQSSW